MLIDESVSQNILPGICKALENFIILYKMDEVVKSTGDRLLKLGGTVASVVNQSGMLLAKQKKDKINEFVFLKESNILEDEIPPTKGGNTIDSSTLQAVSKSLEVYKSLASLGNVKIDRPQGDSLSLEPTYVVAQTSAGTKIIGVKVIPFPVKSKYPLAKILTVEKSLKFFDTLTLSLSRRVIRDFWAVINHLKIPFVSKNTISGDPRKDILWGRSLHQDSIFCLINYSDLKDDFFQSASQIKKLHSIGWSSFIVADDVNKRVTFCMKEFNGLCSIVPYNYLMASMSMSSKGSFLDVYEKLEDLKKASSPFFRTKKPIDKI